MTNQDNQSYINQYIQDISRLYKQSDKEHTFRSALSNLIENLSTGIDVINEGGKAIKNVGAFDYVIKRKSISIIQIILFIQTILNLSYTVVVMMRLKQLKLVKLLMVKYIH